MKSNQLTYYTVVSLLARSAGGTNWSTEMFLERHRHQCVKPHRSRLELYTHKLNLNLYLIAGSSQPGQRVLNLLPLHARIPGGGSIQWRFGRGLPLSRCCRTIPGDAASQAFKKRPEIEPKTPRGPTGEQGRECLQCTWRSNMCRVGTKQNVEDDSSSKLFFFFFL